ncbi:MAG: HD domain-containing protein, partial [Gammaproteobacteria bacterium]|nr:HD domain-containing protein [Gammaproteobacteria bacterium]
IGMSENECAIILNSSPLHDIGKIGIPDRILLKPGKLDEEEWKIMKNHTLIGVRILEGDDCELLNAARTIALTHHEKWDGSGYPNGVAGEDIPVMGRLVAICDVFDALISKRPYKKAWSMDDTIELLKKERGKHFDPHLLDCFLGILPEVLDIKTKCEETSGREYHAHLQIMPSDSCLI